MRRIRLETSVIRPERVVIRPQSRARAEKEWIWGGPKEVAMRPEMRRIRLKTSGIRPERAVIRPKPRGRAEDARMWSGRVQEYLLINGLTPGRSCYAPGNAPYPPGNQRHTPGTSRHPPANRGRAEKEWIWSGKVQGYLLINGLTPESSCYAPVNAPYPPENQRHTPGTSRHPPETPPGHRIDTPSQFLHNFYFTLLIPPYSLNV